MTTREQHHFAMLLEPDMPMTHTASGVGKRVRSCVFVTAEHLLWERKQWDVSLQDAEAKRQDAIIEKQLKKK